MVCRQTKSRQTACLPLDHADSKHICDGEETSESALCTWIPTQGKREAVAQHLLLCIKCVLLQVPQGHWQSDDPVTCPGAHQLPGALRVGATGSGLRFSADRGRHSSAQRGWVVRAGTAHLSCCCTRAPGWPLFQGLSNGNTRSSASNQASLHSLASLLQLPAKASPQQGLAVASLPTPEET